MLQPLVRRTWAPRGQTPLVRQGDRRDRLSVISALTVAPARRRCGLYWTLQRHNIRGGDVLAFLRDLRRHLPHGFTLIWDRSQPQRAATVRAWLAVHAPRLLVEWLPAYAPDGNPAEHVWGHTKYGALANFTPADLAQLEGTLVTSLTATRSKRGLLAAFFRAAGVRI